MFWNLLTASETATNNGGGTWLIWIIFIGIAAIYIISGNRRYKKQQAAAKEEQEKKLAALRPGAKVTTIGYVCGVIAKVNDDETFVLETGDEENKSYITFDIKAIADIKLPEDEAAESVEENATEATEENKDAE